MRVNIICPLSSQKSIKKCIPSLSKGNKLSNIEFVFNGNKEFYDGIVVLQSTSKYQRRNIVTKDGNALLIVREPQDILRMPSKYINQFDHVLTPNAKVNGLNTISNQFGEIWSTDQSYESLATMMPINKTRCFSTVTSTKVVTKGHKQRLNFIRKIQKELPDHFDWYGRGVREINDKWDAIAPYKYHLVFENGCWDHYWTEKLTDAFIGFSLPIYIGCPNVTDYFDEKSIIVLNKCPYKAIDQLKYLLKNDVYEDVFDHVISARNKVIHEYSIFNLIARLINKYFSDNVRYKTIDLYEFENIAYRYDFRKLVKKYWYNLKIS